MPTTVLIIECNSNESKKVIETLKESSDHPFEIFYEPTIDDGIRWLNSNGADCIIIDISHCDSEECQILKEAKEKLQDYPFIVLTNFNQKNIGIEALKSGAIDDLIIEQLDQTLLIKSIQYAIEKHTLSKELEKTKELERKERELRLYEKLSGQHRLVSAKLYGIVSIKENNGEIFSELVEKYENLLDLALQEISYAEKTNLTEEIRLFVDQLGFLRAGPRDVVEIHKTAIQRKSKESNLIKTKAYLEEGRMVLLEIMGYLCAYYRMYSLGNCK